MAVIVSDSRNASYDSYLATANGFYRAEAFNLSSYGATSALALTTIRVQGVTFANAGNCQGLILCLQTISTGSTNRNIDVRLQEAIPVDSFNTSTERINRVSHGLANGTPVAFTSTGTLPTGISTTANTIYYVINQTANDFQIATTVGGSAVGLSGTPSGTATIWADRASKTLSTTDIMGTLPSSGTANNKYPMFASYVPFDFATPYAVDTTASKWRFHVFQTGGSTGTWTLLTSDNTNPSYITWCDTQVSHTDGDVLIVKDLVIINKNATIDGVLSTGDTANSICGIVCRNTDYTIDNVALLRWHPTPTTAYTFTIKGKLIIGGHAGMRIGTSSVPIPAAYPATISFQAATLGTSVVSEIIAIQGQQSTSTWAGKESFFAYGEIPAVRATTLTADAVIGQAHLLVADDVSSWQNGDIVIAGKQDVLGQGVTTATVLSSVTGGTDITLTANLATYNRLSGGSVVNFSRGYGVYFVGQSGTNYGNIRLMYPSNFVIKGCSFVDVRITGDSRSYYYVVDDPTYRSQHIIEDNTARSTSNTVAEFIVTKYIPIDGCSVKRNYTFRTTLVTAIAGYSSASIKSGYLYAHDNIVISNYTATAIAANGVDKLDARRNKFENSARYGVSVGGLELIFTDNTFWGILATPSSSYYACQIDQCINPVEIGRNTFDKCGVAFYHTNAVSKKCVDTGSQFGTTSANTVDIKVTAGAIIDYIFKNVEGSLTYDLALMSDAISGSKLRFVDLDNVTHADTVITPEGKFIRSGYGLSDTTVWTGSAFGAASAGQFAMRCIPDLNSAAPLSYGQTKTTGDIQGKLMTVSARVMIKNAAYYAGVHQSPTLRVVYDGLTEVSSTAADNTSAQLLQVSFTPTTTEGSIEVYIEGSTDAVEADAEFYIGELNIPLPEGVAVDTTRFGTWVDAIPLPSISTFEAPTSAWNAADSAYNTPGTMGNLLHKTLSVAKFLGLK